MNVAEFRASLASDLPSKEMGFALKALWWDAKGDWIKAHELAQEDEGSQGAWVHAYLHRKEGDDSNAAYWYGQAGKKPFHGSFEDEWKQIVSRLLE
jgi:hypothetical protein